MPIEFPELSDDPVTFERPPVVEVAVAAQFAGVALDLDTMGEFRSRVRGDYPERDQQPAPPPMTEDFGIPPVPTGLQIQIGTAAVRDRFTSADNNHLIQAQPDRIGLNWRRPAGGEGYPRYRGIRERFAAVLSQLADAKATVGGELPPLNFIEVTYVNQLVLDPGEGRTHPDLGAILTPIVPGRVGTFLPQAEDGQVRLRYRIPATDDLASEGRLYVTAEPAFAPNTNEPLFLMVLTARLPVQGVQLADSYIPLDRGREWIVEGFKDLTRPEMHQIWGLQPRGEEDL